MAAVNMVESLTSENMPEAVDSVLDEFLKLSESNFHSSIVDECNKNLSISSVKGNLKWLGDFEALKTLFDQILNSQTTWSKPGGSCRKLELDNLSIRWYMGSQSLMIKGKDEDKIKDCLRNLVRDAPVHDDIINSSNVPIEILDDKSLMKQTVNISKSEEVSVLLDKVKEMEERFEVKFNDLSDDVCKLKELDSFKTILSRDRICQLERENDELKSENAALKHKVDHTTFVMSDLNTKLKLMEDEKQSLVTALKLLQSDVSEVNKSANNKWSEATHTNKRKNSPARPKAIDIPLNNEEEGCSLVNRYCFISAG